MVKKAFLIQSVALSLIFIAAIVSYIPSMNAGYFADDYMFKFHDVKISPNSILTSTHAYAYRPVEKLFLATMQHKYPEDTWPIHATNLCLHLLFSMSIMILMRREGFSRLSSIIAFGTMALSQANSHAVSSLDTFSQITSTVFGYSSLFLFLCCIKRQIKDGYPFYLFSLFLSVIAILCKESAMFIIPIMFMLVFLYSIRHYSHNSRKIIVLWASLVPFILISAVFMLLRKHMNLIPVEIGSDKYNIGLGINIIKNFSMAVIQAIQPHSSVALYFDIVNKRWASVLFIMLFSVFFSVVVIRGTIFSKYRMHSLFMVLMLPLSMFPFILLNHISELYVYNTMPLVAILIGIGLGESFEQIKSRHWKAGLLCLISGFLVWNTISVFSKCILMKQNGTEAENILQKIEPYFSQIPYNGNLILINPNTSKKTEYSIFKRTGFRLFEDGTDEFARRTGRDDFKTLIIMEQDFNLKRTILL